MYRSLCGIYLTPAGFSLEQRQKSSNVFMITLGPYGSKLNDVIEAIQDSIVALEYSCMFMGLVKTTQAVMNDRDQRPSRLSVILKSKTSAPIEDAIICYTDRFRDIRGLHTECFEDSTTDSGIDVSFKYNAMLTGTSKSFTQHLAYHQ